MANSTRKSVTPFARRGPIVAAQTQIAAAQDIVPVDRTPIAAPVLIVAQDLIAADPARAGALSVARLLAAVVVAKAVVIMVGRAHIEVARIMDTADRRAKHAARSS